LPRDKSLPEEEQLKQIRNKEYWKFPALSMLILAAANVQKIKSAAPGTFGLTNLDGPDLIGHVAIKKLQDTAKLYIQQAGGAFEIREGKGWDSVLACLKIADASIKMIMEAVEQKQGVLIIVGDHGSVDDMTQPNHSFNNVPIFIIDFKNRNIKLVRGKDGRQDTQADVAVTVLHILGKDKPVEMTGKSLLPDNYVGSPDRIVWQVILDGFGHTDAGDPNNAFAVAMKPDASGQCIMPTIKGLYDDAQKKGDFIVLRACGHYAGLRGGRQEYFKKEELIHERSQMINAVKALSPARIRITYYDYDHEYGEDICKIAGATQLYTDINSAWHELEASPFLNDKDFVVRKTGDEVEVLCLDYSQMGSTEYNTWTLGAGRIVKQPIVFIDELCISGQMADNPVFKEYVAYAKKQGWATIVTTLQEAGVHASNRQLYYYIKFMKAQGVKRFVFDVAVDGRDEAKQDGIKRIRQLRAALKYLGVAEADYSINICGREICFDRAKNWNLTEGWINQLLWGSRIDRRWKERIIEEWLGDLPPEAPLINKVIRLVERVRDIPYGHISSRSPRDVYKRNMGTSSGKNELLKQLLAMIGVKSVIMMVETDWNAFAKTYSGIPFPPQVTSILDKARITGYYHCLEIIIGGKRVFVDIGWDKALKVWGFPVNEGWTGRKDMRLSVVKARHGKIYRPTDAISFKARSVAALPLEMQNLREDFLNALTQWLIAAREWDLEKRQHAPEGSDPPEGTDGSNSSGQIGGKWPFLQGFYNEVSKSMGNNRLSQWLGQAVMPAVIESGVAPALLIGFMAGGALLLSWVFGLPLTLAPPFIFLNLILYQALWHHLHLIGAQKGLSGRQVVFGSEKLFITLLALISVLVLTLSGLCLPAPLFLGLALLCLVVSHIFVNTVLILDYKEMLLLPGPVAVGNKSYLPYPVAKLLSESDTLPSVAGGEDSLPCNGVRLVGDLSAAGPLFTSNQYASAQSDAGGGVVPFSIISEPDISHLVYLAHFLLFYQERKIKLTINPEGAFREVDSRLFLNNGRNKVGIVLPGISNLNLALFQRECLKSQPKEDLLYFIPLQENMEVGLKSGRLMIRQALYVDSSALEAKLVVLRFSQPLPLDKVIYNGTDKTLTRSLEDLGYPKVCHYDLVDKITSKEIFEKAEVATPAYIVLKNSMPKSAIEKAIEYFV
jgi:hypothetical protein